MTMIMSFDRSANAKRQVKNWRLEAVRNGAHRPDRETRCGKIRYQRFFTTEDAIASFFLSRLYEAAGAAMAYARGDMQSNARKTIGCYTSSPQARRTRRNFPQFRAIRHA